MTNLMPKMTQKYPTYLLDEGTAVVIDHDDQRIVLVQESGEDDDEGTEPDVVILTLSHFDQLIDILKTHLTANGELINRENMNVH